MVMTVQLPAMALAAPAARAPRPAAPAPDRAPQDTPQSRAATPTPTPSDAVSAYDDAMNTFQYQDFDSAVPKLRALLYPETTLDYKREWKARECLSAALWWQGEFAAAREELTALLVRNAQARFDAAVYPPKMIADFETQRQTLVRLGVIKADQLPKVPDTPPQKVEPPPYALMWFPFGVGQFANREPGKAMALLVGQVLLAGGSAAMYHANTVEYQQTAQRSLSRDATQLSLSAGFWLLAAWGVWDATRTWKKAE
jgi:hypothetical protein